MQQPRGSPIPPTMIPTPVGARLSRTSMTSSGRYYSRSTLGSSSSNTSGRSRSISTTYTRANNSLGGRPLLAKRASTGSHHSLLRKVVGRSTTATPDDDGYDSDFEEQPAFDAVKTLEMRFNRSPKTAATLRALRIMEQRTGASSVASANVTDDEMGRPDANRKERKELVEDWSDDYEIPKTAGCIAHSESPKHVPVVPLNREIVYVSADTITKDAMHDTMKYEPLIAPVDAISSVTDTFFSQGGFTRGSSTEDLSVDHIPDNSLDIDEMMARHSDFANATQLLNKTEHLDFSTTSFQVWRDVPSSLSIDSFSNSLIMAPAVNHDNNPFVRAPLQPKTLVRRTPSKLRNTIEITPPEEAIEAGVPEIVLQDATEGSVSPDTFPSRIFETYPSGASTLPIWADSVSFFTALEAPSEGDLLSLGGQRIVGETRNQLDDGTRAAGSLVINRPFTSTTVEPVPISNPKSCTASSELSESILIAPSDSFLALTTMSASNSSTMSDFSLSLSHQQAEATVMDPSGFHIGLTTTSNGWSGSSISPTRAVSATAFPPRLPVLRQGLTSKTFDVGAIITTEGAPTGLIVDDQHDFAVSATSFAVGTPVVTDARPKLSTPLSTWAGCDFPTIESLVSLPDFYEFSSSVPVGVLEQPSTLRPLFSHGNDAESFGSTDFEDALLRSLPAPVTRLSAEEARDWGRVFEICVITPSPTTTINTRHEVETIVTAARAPSCMDETPPLNGEIFAVDDAAGLRDIREQEEEDIILPAPLLVNNVSEFMGLSSKDLSLEPRDLVCEVAVFIARADGAPPSNHRDTLPKREEQLRSQTTRTHGSTRRRVSAIERWREACAKTEISSLEQTSATCRDFPSVESLSASSAVHHNLCRSVSSPPFTQEYHSLIAVTQAAHASVSQTQSPVVGLGTCRDLHTHNTNGCARKRRSKRTRSAPKSSFLSKASSVPISLRRNTSGTASKESGPELVASSTSAPHTSGPFFVEGSMAILDSALRCVLKDERQNSADAFISPIGTAPKDPSSSDKPDIFISEGWENAGMSFWGSPRSGKRKKLRDLFKRPAPLEGASTTHSGPDHSTDLPDPSVSRCKSRRLFFGPKHHNPPHSPPQDAIPNSSALPSAVNLPPSKSPKQKHLGFNWIARSRASTLLSSSANSATAWSSDTMPIPHTKPKGGRLGSVVHKLQSFL